jgi:class 3 adenylate cyclase
MRDMEALPSGTVTFAFTDIEGSTALLKQLGAHYESLLMDHRRIVRETFTRANGVEIDAQGDAFFFAFGRARDAVGAAVDVQRAHVAHDWPDGVDVRVRLGLHTGEPALGSEGYLGLDVVRAARLCTLARGGEVLLSETTRLLAGSSLPEGVAIFPVGERQLKDIDQPERVYELAIDGVRAEPAPATPDTPAIAAAAEKPSDFGKALEAQIRGRVERELLEAFGDSAHDAHDDVEVDELAGRSTDLGERIRTRVEAALRAKGIAPDR